VLFAFARGTACSSERFRSRRLARLPCHMRLLLPKIEEILGSMAVHTAATTSPGFIEEVCNAVMAHLKIQSGSVTGGRRDIQREVSAAQNFGALASGVTLFLHRVLQRPETNRASHPAYLLV
jgi:hypothetical protein